ncbi:hypothetical protein Y032_0224g2727 [Ancylostoma ceylanicum]|uniref:Uncharacterized protein n=1 Tax=Ancylostoma ceylanicum TaxID=53326 RepID=A0A016SID3_9BILA|nr:hypothetical protein Y032_0224g2727 [Ancylostoma ceylanicum]
MPTLRTYRAQAKEPADSSELETVENLVKPSWIFTASPPFLEKVTSLYMFNLLQVTSPPQEISSTRNDESAHAVEVPRLPAIHVIISSLRITLHRYLYDIGQ